MEKEKYLEMRNGLYNEAKKLIDEGSIKEGQAKMKEIEDLDNKFEEEAKAMANLNALKDNVKITDIQNKGVNVAGKVIDFIDDSNAAKTGITNTLEYRKAFMNYALHGTPMNGFSNSNDNTKQLDVGAVIPETIIEKIVEKMEATGMILPLVTRTSYKGGVSIPTSTVKPVATWVAEGVGSDKQKKTTGSITFGAYKLRCAISMSLEVSVMALPIFETIFISNVAEAMTKALEEAIINGSGTGQPKGILKETVVTGQNIDIDKDADFTYADLVNAEAAIPLAYESDAVWCMTKKTFMKFIGMQDSNGQPIARVNYGINGKPERVLLGRTVILNDYMTSVDATISTNTVVAFIFNFKDYVLNTNYNMTIKRYEDNDTDDQVTKAIMLADGKVIDNNSLVTITKKSA